MKQLGETIVPIPFLGAVEGYCVAGSVLHKHKKGLKVLGNTHADLLRPDVVSSR